MTTTTLPTTNRAHIVGSGPLAEVLRTDLPATTDRLTVIADPGLDLDALLAVQAEAISAGRTVIPVRAIGPSLEIGPRTVPGQPGCARCGAIRHRAVLRSGLMHPLLATEPPRLPLPDRWLQVVTAAVAAFLGGELPDGTAVVITPLTGELSRHRISPVPGCPGCAPLPVDAPASAWQPSVPLVQDEPLSLRTKALPAAERLADELADHRYGPVLQTYRDPVSPTAFVGVELVMPSGGRMWGYGRAGDYERAKSIGLLEAIERETGSAPAARRTIVRGSYDDLRRYAVDPVCLGLPDPAYEGHSNSLLDPYRPDIETRWVWAHDLVTDRAVLLPEHVAYYGIASEPGAARFLYECSSGCAVGGTLAEAVLYGALELIERDAFLLHWYSQTPPRPVLPASLTDPESRALVARAAAEGYEVRIFDITGDVGIPVYWVAGLAPGNPAWAHLSAAGAHPDPDRAVRSALHELLSMIVIYAPTEPIPTERRLSMLDDPESVVEMEDHVGLFTTPESLDRLGWALDSGRPAIPLMHEDWRARWIRPDLTETLTLVVDAMAAAGMPPIAVRQTSARDARLGVEVAKVVAPGSLPMTFGHVHHRTRGIPRLAAARARTGITNLQPHPFP